MAPNVWETVVAGAARFLFKGLELRNSAEMASCYLPPRLTRNLLLRPQALRLRPIGHRDL
jgi:hypothetical protein